MTHFRSSDIYDERGSELDAIALNFQNVGGLEFFSGPAKTASVFQDNGLLKEIMRRPGDGAVLVVDGFGSLACTLLGGNMAKIFLDNGWAGVVINGAVRDRNELAEIPFGVLALGSSPKRSRKTGAGQEGTVLNVGGVSIRPGAMVYADSDGVLVEN